jgi:hypothetical protein
LTITDIPSRTTYDENGNRQSLPKESYEDFERSSKYRPEQTRKLTFNILGGEDAKIYWGNCPVPVSKINGNLFETAFPVTSSSESIPYRIDASAEEWQTLATWDLKDKSDTFSLDREDPENGPLIVQSLPGIDTSGLTMFRVMMRFKKDPKETSGNEWEAIPGETKREVACFVKKEEIQSISLESRRYRTVKSGFLAYGRKGDPAMEVRADGLAKVINIRRTQKTNSEVIAKWDMAGKNIRTFSYDVGGLIKPKMPDDERMISIRFGIAEYDKNKRAKFTSSVGSFSMYGNEGQVGPTGVEWTAWMAISEKVRKIDVNVDVPTGEYKEILRVSQFATGKRGTEKPRTAILDTTYASKKWNRGPLHLLARVPKEYRNQDLRVRLVKEGRLVDSPMAMTSTTDGYVGFQTLAVKNPIKGISEFIVEARPYKRTVIKDVPLYPKD